MACGNLTTLLNGNMVCFSNSSSANELGKRFTFRNPEQKPICRVKIDDCYITDGAIKKCDFLFEVGGDHYYLVELKGTDIATAIEQIVNTFEIVNAKIKTSATKYKGIVVSSGVPSSANQKFRNMADKVRRDKKIVISRTTNQHEERI
jgi:hypothetical protein